MFSSKQTHKFDYFICYHPESGCRKSQGARLIYFVECEYIYTFLDFCIIYKRQTIVNFEWSRKQI